jgi:hypothetical protein
VRHDPFRQFAPISIPSPALHESRRHENCFADEIAIDFPAVDHLLERVRDEFLGETADDLTLTHDVELSGHDAALGVVVPFDVPLRTTCTVCGGRGEVWAEPCRACAGSGDTLRHTPVRLAVPSGVADGARLRFRVHPHGTAPVRIEVRVAIVRPKSF